VAKLVAVRPLWETNTLTWLVFRAVHRRVLVQVRAPAEIVQGFGEALIVPVWAKSCGAARTGPKTQSIQTESLFVTTHHQSAGQAKEGRTVANSHVMLGEVLLT
jgi:hypothetical protein